MTDDEIVEVEEITGEEAIRSAELVIHEEQARAMPPASVLPSSKEWEATMAVAREIAGTQFVPESYRGKPDAVVAAILTGREMGIGPMQSLRQIHMIDGRPAFAADLMMAKMRAGGIVILESEVTEERAYIKAQRKDTGEEAEVEWTVEQARQAGLLDKRGKSWERYRTDMLWARAVGRLARRLGSDLLGGLVYSKEEIEDWDDGGYGGSQGYEASLQKPFNPETDLAPNAITGENAQKRIFAALVQFDPTVDWNHVLDQLARGYVADAEWRDLEGGDYQDWLRRLSNFVWWVGQNTPEGDFPPVDADRLREGFEYAFSGIAVEISYKDVQVPEVVQEAAEIPFDPPEQGE